MFFLVLTVCVSLCAAVYFAGNFNCVCGGQYAQFAGCISPAQAWLLYRAFTAVDRTWAWMMMHVVGKLFLRKCGWRGGCLNHVLDEVVITWMPGIEMSFYSSRIISRSVICFFLITTLDPAHRACEGICDNAAEVRLLPLRRHGWHHQLGEKAFHRLHPIAIYLCCWRIQRLMFSGHSSVNHSRRDVALLLLFGRQIKETTSELPSPKTAAFDNHSPIDLD